MEFNQLYKQTHLWNRNRLTDIENKLKATKRERWWGMDKLKSIHTAAAAAAELRQSCVTPVWPQRRQPTRLPPSLGFSRQEHWSGLPLPSPMHESETWKWSRSVVSDSSRPRGLQPTRLLRPWDFPGKSTGVGCHCLLRIYTLLHVK